MDIAIRITHRSTREVKVITCPEDQAATIYALMKGDYLFPHWLENKRNYDALIQEIDRSLGVSSAEQVRALPHPSSAIVANMKIGDRSVRLDCKGGMWTLAAIHYLGENQE